MKRRKYSKLKRNPIVRLIRQVMRFFSRLFKPNQGSARFSYRQGAPLTSNTELNGYADDELITVGELLDQVNWQLDGEIARQETSTDSKNYRTRDVSLN